MTKKKLGINDDNVLRIDYKPTDMNTDSELPQRVFVSINMAVFIFNTLERKFQEIEGILEEYHCLTKASVISDGEHKLWVTWGYEKGDTLIETSWSIIDWGEKLRKILSSITGIKKNERWYKELIASLEKTKSIRNTIQHIDREIKNYISDSTPLMGVVSAQFPLPKGRVTYVISSSTFKSPYKDHINIYGIEATEARSDGMGSVIFSISKKSFNFTSFMAEIRKSVASMKVYLNDNYNYEWPKTTDKVHNL